MPVVRMSEVAWDDSQVMINGQDMSGIRQNQTVRSQDDAMVGYFYQRPQTETQQHHYGGKRWAVGDDSVLEQVGATNATFSTPLKSCQFL